jgi:hypothetical protein
MHPTDKAARVAGAVYLSMAVTAPLLVHDNKSSMRSSLSKLCVLSKRSTR